MSEQDIESAVSSAEAPVSSEIERAKLTAEAVRAVLEVLAPVETVGRERALAAAAIMLGIVPADVVLDELRRQQITALRGSLGERDRKRV